MPAPPIHEPAEGAGAGAPMPSGRTLRIGELAKLTGLTPRTLRYWEELGLLAPHGDRAGGERRYGEAELGRVTHIRELQDLLGLTLAEIRFVLDSEDALERARSARKAGAPTGRRLRLVNDAITANERLIRRIDERLDRIAKFRDECLARTERLRARSRELEESPDNQP